MKLLLTHGHLIVDEHTEFIDGAIELNDDKIIKVFPHTNKIDKSFDDYKIIDLNGKICRPAYFDTHYINDSKGVSSFLYNQQKELTNISDDRCLGYFMDEVVDINLEAIDMYKGITIDLNNYNHELLNDLKEKNIKILLGKSNIDYEDINIEYDGIRNIFFDMKDLNSHIPSLANAAFIDNKYVEFNVDIHESILKLLIKNISSSKLILISNTKTISESVKYLRKLNVKHTDLLAYSCLNAYKLYGLDKLYGSLHKGKKGDLIILDDEYNIIFEYIKGELIYE